MLKNKRKNKIIKRKRIIKLFLYTCICLAVASAGAFLYIIQLSKPMFISPLPKNAAKSVLSAEDKNISLIKDKLKELNIDFENIDVSDEAYVIYLKNKSEIIISANKDVRSQLSSLQFILTRLTMEGRAFNQLDLRFDKPVIRFK